MLFKNVWWWDFFSPRQYSPKPGIRARGIPPSLFQKANVEKLPPRLYLAGEKPNTSDDNTRG